MKLSTAPSFSSAGGWCISRIEVLRSPPKRKAYKWAANIEYATIGVYPPFPISYTYHGQACCAMPVMRTFCEILLVQSSVREEGIFHHKNTYGLEEGPTSEEIVREILPQAKVKRQRQSSMTTTDEDMKEAPTLPVNKVLSNTQTQPESELFVINTTSVNNNPPSNFQRNNTGLNDSIHAMIMNVDHKSHDQNAALINNKENNNQVDLLTEISNEHDITQIHQPTKGKNRELNENQSITEIEIIDINTNDRNLSEKFKVFTLKKYFKNHSDKQIHTCIRNKFATNKNFKFVKSSITKNNNIEIVIISFYDKATRDAIHGTQLGNFPAIFWKYESKEITTIINAELEDLDRCLIKIVDVPKHYTTDDIYNIFKPLGTLNKIILLESSTTSSKSVSKIWENNYWSTKVKNHIIRILPVDNKSNEYIKRTEYSYKITGLYKDTSIEDLEPLIKSIKGKSCTITPSRHP
ncbi:hypothetical protein GLOIN_2v1789675 [Rhizophagus clarus]|uniref:RRM domain-containing protein n=1 Tax=Rhizophagus clarus TaxID=94130 RepID=A0A8H3R4Q0_9GLOM|nr:hypothetical protein GLOIN_2v1789675 [Rhizophagus clarus]